MLDFSNRIILNWENSDLAIGKFFRLNPNFFEGNMRKISFLYAENPSLPSYLVLQENNGWTKLIEVPEVFL